MIKMLHMGILFFLLVPIISLVKGLAIQDMKAVNYRDAVSFQTLANWEVEDDFK